MYPDIRLYRHGKFIESYEGERKAGEKLLVKDGKQTYNLFSTLFSNRVKFTPVCGEDGVLPFMD